MGDITRRQQSGDRTRYAVLSFGTGSAGPAVGDDFWEAVHAVQSVESAQGGGASGAVASVIIDCDIGSLQGGAGSSASATVEGGAPERAKRGGRSVSQYRKRLPPIEPVRIACSVYSQQFGGESSGNIRPLNPNSSAVSSVGGRAVAFGSASVVISAALTGTGAGNRSFAVADVSEADREEELIILALLN